MRAELEPGFICTFSGNTGVLLPQFFRKRCHHRLVVTLVFRYRNFSGKTMSSSFSGNPVIFRCRQGKKREKKETEIVFSEGFFVPALAVAPNTNGGIFVPALAVAPNKKRRNGVHRYISRYKERRPPTTQDIPYLLKSLKSLQSLQSCSSQTY